MLTKLITLILLLDATSIFAQNGFGYPEVIVSDRTQLTRVRKNLEEGGKQYEAGVQFILKEAKKILKSTPPTVMSKNQTPPSGDNHDYMSLAPYHWPDPAKKDGLPYIRKDGQRNPEAAELTDHENLVKTCKQIYTLSLAYYFSGDKQFAVKAVEYLNAWFITPATKMNPNMQFAQAVKGVNDGRGAGIIESRHLIWVIDALRILEGSAAFDKSTSSGVREWFQKYFIWLRQSKNGIHETKARNNHGTWYTVQALTIAMYLDLKDEVNTLCEGIIPRIEWQIEPDGKQPEELVRTTSLGYSHFNVQALSVLLKIAKNSGKEYWKYSSPDGRSLKKAVDFLYPFAKGDEEWKFEQIKEPSKEDMAICYFYAYYFWNEKKYLDLAKQLTGGEAHKLLLPVTLVETLPQ